MQREVGAALFARHGIDPADPDTILVIYGDRVLRDPDAVLSIYAELGWLWRVAGWLRAMPPALRDPSYRLIARNRYRLFGRRETYWLPSPADRERVLLAPSWCRGATAGAAGCRGGWRRRGTR
jgi:predicted DCC family thiol-disulfide oxidoreductase YuxK